MICGGSFTESPTLEQRKLLYRIYRHLNAAHALCYKSVSESLNRLDLDDFSDQLGLLTNEEIKSLYPYPSKVRDAVLTIGFTNKPVRVQVNRGIVRVKQGPDDDQPRIYFDEIEGAFLEPSPLPKPVRIAYAKGLVRLAGKPLVDLVARACIGRSELRIHAMVPKKKSQVQTPTQ